MMRNIVAVFALALAFAGCGVAPQEELLPISSTEAAPTRSGDVTTRDVCTACGCVASDAACDCGTASSPGKLDCIYSGGPVQKESLGGIATSPGASRAGTSAWARPELTVAPYPSPTPLCPSGEVRHCTLGPPPVCSCIPITVGALAQ